MHIYFSTYAPQVLTQFLSYKYIYSFKRLICKFAFYVQDAVSLCTNAYKYVLALESHSLRFQLWISTQYWAWVLDDFNTEISTKTELSQFKAQFFTWLITLSKIWQLFKYSCGWRFWVAMHLWNCRMYMGKIYACAHM